MSHYRLPEHLGVCEIDRRLLMLDLRRDRYLELDAGSAASLRRWRNGLQEEEASLARLLERGMLVPSDRPDTSGWTEHAIPDRSMLDLPEPRAPWSLLPELAATFLATRMRLRSGLEVAVMDIKRRKPATTLTDPRTHVARFRAARRFVPITPNCLTDSLALAACLSRRQIRCDLIFGVKLDPFAAHCWLQTDRAVLNDAADRVAAFTPIMVV